MFYLLVSFNVYSLSLGLIISTRACYNPEAAVTSMVKLAKLDNLSEDPFLRTHPLGEDRIQHLQVNYTDTGEIPMILLI